MKQMGLSFPLRKLLFMVPFLVPSVFSLNFFLDTRIFFAGTVFESNIWTIRCIKEDFILEYFLIPDSFPSKTFLFFLLTLFLEIILEEKISFWLDFWQFSYVLPCITKGFCLSQHSYLVCFLRQMQNRNIYCNLTSDILWYLRSNFVLMCFSRIRFYYIFCLIHWFLQVTKVLLPKFFSRVGHNFFATDSICFRYLSPMCFEFLFLVLLRPSFVITFSF